MSISSERASRLSTSIVTAQRLMPARKRFRASSPFLRTWTEARQARPRRRGGAIGSRDGGGRGSRPRKTWLKQAFEKICRRWTKSPSAGSGGKSDSKATGNVNLFCSGTYPVQHVSFSTERKVHTRLMSSKCISLSFPLASGLDSKALLKSERRAGSGSSFADSTS